MRACKTSRQRTGGWQCGTIQCASRAACNAWLARDHLQSIAAFKGFVSAFSCVLLMACFTPPVTSTPCAQMRTAANNMPICMLVHCLRAHCCCAPCSCQRSRSAWHKAPCFQICAPRPQRMQDISSEADCQTRFAAISEAYTVLSDPAARAHYDHLQNSAQRAAAAAAEAAQREMRPDPFYDLLRRHREHSAYHKGRFSVGSVADWCASGPQLANK